MHTNLAPGEKNPIELPPVSADFRRRQTEFTRLVRRCAEPWCNGTNPVGSQDEDNDGGDCSWLETLRERSAELLPPSSSSSSSSLADRINSA